MNILLVCDSLYGNTQNLAEIIQEELARFHSITLINIADFTNELLLQHDVLLIASPTHAFRAKQETIDMLDGLDDNLIKNYPVLSFDTRIELTTIKNRLWRWMVNKAGYASPFINKQLKSKGALVLAEPKGFLVMDKEGPIKSGEIEKAQLWTEELIEIFSKLANNMQTMNV